MNLEQLLSIPKSMYVCLRLFPLKQAIKLPMIVRYNTKLISLKGRVYTSKSVKMAMFRYGFGDIGVLDKKYQRSMLEINGILSIEEDTFIGQGARLSVGRQGRLHFGNKFRNSGGMTIMAEESVTFGDNVLVSWGTNIMDTDYHSVIDINTGLVKKHFSPIYIGNKVWLGCSILKGTTIAEGCVIGAFAVVAKSFETPNSLIVGSPAIEKANNITRFID